VSTPRGSREKTPGHRFAYPSKTTICNHGFSPGFSELLAYRPDVVPKVALGGKRPFRAADWFAPLVLDPKTGRMLPISDEELAARRDAALRMLQALDQITDESDTDEKWSEVYRNIDACRPHRPLFRGLY